MVRSRRRASSSGVPKRYPSAGRALESQEEDHSAHHLVWYSRIRIRLASQSHKITLQTHDPGRTRLQMLALLRVRSYPSNARQTDRAFTFCWRGLPNIVDELSGESEA